MTWKKFSEDFPAMGTDVKVRGGSLSDNFSGRADRLNGVLDDLFYVFDYDRMIRIFIDKESDLEWKEDE